jgi:hypothetical protein
MIEISKNSNCARKRRLSGEEGEDEEEGDMRNGISKNGLEAYSPLRILCYHSFDEVVPASAFPIEMRFRQGPVLYVRSSGTSLSSSAVRLVLCSTKPTKDPR